MANIIAGDSMFSIEEYLRDPEPAQACLASIHACHTPAQCTCQRDRRPIVVRRLDNHYVLACWPDDGPNHHVSCHFYRPLSPESPKQQHTVSNSVHPTPQRPVVGPDNFPAPATLMHELLLRSRFGTWGPGWKRDWWRAQRSLTTASETITWGNTTLRERFFAPKAFRQDRINELRQSWSQFRDALIPGSSGVICGELKSVVKHDALHQLHLAHHAFPVDVPSLHFNAMLVSSPLAIGLLDVRRDYRCRILALLVVQARTDGHLICIGGSLQLTNQVYMPVYSVHDLQLANHLCDLGRKFERGLKSDPFNFLLTDTNPATPLVVSGGASASARSRHRERMVACAAVSPSLWHWDFGSTTAAPPLPMPNAG